MIALKKILVATDFSEPSDAALAYGRELARTFGATLDVLHVADNVLTRALRRRRLRARSIRSCRREIEAARAAQRRRAALRRRPRRCSGAEAVWSSRRMHAAGRHRRLRARREQSI